MPERQRPDSDGLRTVRHTLRHFLPHRRRAGRQRLAVNRGRIRLYRTPRDHDFMNQKRKIYRANANVSFCPTLFGAREMPAGKADGSSGRGGRKS